MLQLLSGSLGCILPWGYLINLSICDELAMCPLAETFFFLIPSQLGHHLFRWCAFSVFLLPSWLPFFQMFPIPRTLVYTYSPFSECSIFFSQYFQDFQCGYVSFSSQFFKLGAVQGLFKGSFISISFKVSAFNLRVQSCLPLSPPDKFSTPTDPA